MAPDGTKQLVTIGGLIKEPLSVTVHPTTGMLYVTESYYQDVVIVDPNTGHQEVFVANVGGRFLVPGGVAFDQEGNLFMTDHGTNDIMKIDPQGNVEEFLDGPSNGIYVPAGIEIDGSGNIFVASYQNSNILRLRHDTAEWEVFCTSPLLDEPNDIELDTDGTLLVSSSEASSVVRIDALGNASLVYQDVSLGQFLGVAIERTNLGANGTMTEYGSGTAGEGGFVPRLSGIFSPVPGGEVAYVVDRGSGGKSGVMLWGLGAASYPAWGGAVLIDFTKFWSLFHFTLGGSGPGTGEVRFRVVHPDDPVLEHMEFFMQGFVLDPANAFGIAMTQGLHITFGV
jgi:sugar lactone lactonase YvrE